MQLARRTRSYVKFIIAKKYYIMVTYHRNGKTNIQTNIRFDSQFLRNLFFMENRGYSENTWAEFIRVWANRFAVKLNSKNTY